MTAGEIDLRVLLKEMHPVLNPGKYVFCIMDDSQGVDYSQIIASFKEKEGLTVVLAQSTADAWGLSYSLVTSWITLTIHSSLEAVGLTAAVATALTKADISCNVIAAVYHDHVFVPVPDTDKAMQVLQQLSHSS